MKKNDPSRLEIASNLEVKAQNICRHNASGSSMPMIYSRERLQLRAIVSSITARATFPSRNFRRRQLLIAALTLLLLNAEQRACAGSTTWRLNPADSLRNSAPN